MFFSREIKALSCGKAATDLPFPPSSAEEEEKETCLLLGDKVCVSRSVVSTLCDPMDYSLPGSSVHGILQARTLEWVAIPFSRGSS